MERIFNGDEKIRRAEEIYYRRKMGIPRENIREKKINKSTYLGSKICLDILVIINLAIIILAIQNKDFIFTKEFLKKVQEYNINLTDSIKAFYNSNEIIENEPMVEEEIKTEVNNEELPTEIVPNNEEVSSINQMDSDIELIKNNYTFVSPLIGGTVTSNFGARESVYQNVTGYHTGIDIGSEKGTSIKAAISGKVILVSTKGDYGKHLKIENGDLITLYAHCSKILVNENDIVESGQEIAKVGSTGNSTGPHLHFEIRYKDRFIDPSKVVSF